MMSETYKKRVKTIDEVKTIIQARYAQGFNHFHVASLFDVSGDRICFQIETDVGSIPNVEDKVRELETQIKKLKESIELYKALLKEVL